LCVSFAKSLLFHITSDITMPALTITFVAATAASSAAAVITTAVVYKGLDVTVFKVIPMALVGGGLAIVTQPMGAVQLGILDALPKDGTSEANVIRLFAGLSTIAGGAMYAAGSVGNHYHKAAFLGLLSSLLYQATKFLKANPSIATKTLSVLSKSVNSNLAKATCCAAGATGLLAFFHLAAPCVSRKIGLDKDCHKRNLNGTPAYGSKCGCGGKGACCKKASACCGSKPSGCATSCCK